MCCTVSTNTLWCYNAWENRYCMHSACCGSNYYMYVSLFCMCICICNSYRMALIFCRSLFSRILQIWRHSRNYFNEIFEPKGIITRAPRGRTLSASVWSLNRELKATRSSIIMLKIHDERGDHTQLLQPWELAMWQLALKPRTVSYLSINMLHPYYHAWARSTQCLCACICWAFSRNYFNENVKNSYMRNFRPAKYKHYTVYHGLLGCIGFVPWGCNPRKYNNCLKGTNPYTHRSPWYDLLVPWCILIVMHDVKCSQQLWQEHKVAMVAYTPLAS